MSGHRLIVHKRDRRRVGGVRFVKIYDYPSYSQEAMMNEIRALKQNLYKDRDGWILTFEPMTKIVKNLITGKMVEIDYRTPHSCDPSTETYWSM